MPATLTLTRRGTFTVEHVGDDTTQCGRLGTRKFFFRVEIDCPETGLDAQGFMVDQFDVLRLMRTRYRRVAHLKSCEGLALDAARALLARCPMATEVRATVGAGRFAFMTARVPRE
jgi:hypothetical protein